jgi:hypothetical protein
MRLQLDQTSRGVVWYCATGRSKFEGVIPDAPSELLGDEFQNLRTLAIDVHLTTSIPSVNFTPRMTFGNWLWPSRRRQLFFSGLSKLEDHRQRGLIRETSLGSHGAVAHPRERAFDDIGRTQMLPEFGRKVIEGERCVSILDQTA